MNGYAITCCFEIYKDFLKSEFGLDEPSNVAQ
jgi:hypothetical protein